MWLLFFVARTGIQCYCNFLPTDIAWLHLHCMVVLCPGVIKLSHMDLLHFRSEYSCLNWHLNKFLFQSRRSCLDWRFSVSESASFINRLVSRSMHKCLTWRLIGSRRSHLICCPSLGATAQVELEIALVSVTSAVVGVPVFALAATQVQTYRVQSLTGVELVLRPNKMEHSYKIHL